MSQIQLRLPLSNGYLQDGNNSMFKKIINGFLCAAVIGFVPNASAIQWGDDEGGATRDYYNAAVNFPWGRFMGDWTGKNGRAWDETAYSSKRFDLKKGTQVIELDVTHLVKEWVNQKYPNEGFFLRHLGGMIHTIRFYSRENGSVIRAPTLILQDATGAKYRLTSKADTYLSASTYKSLGKEKFLTLSRKKPILIWIDLSKLPREFKLASASLQLTIAKIYGNTSVDIGAYRTDPAPQNTVDNQVQWGIAVAYTHDEGIQQHPDVLYAEKFETEGWLKPWYGERAGEEIVGISDHRNRFIPFFKSALAVTIKKGRSLGINQHFKFRQQNMKEPEEAYFRYYIRLGDNWNQTVDGGKLPGLSGTYGKAGWGGRKPNGYNGWSARGRFEKSVPTDSENPFRGLNPIGSLVGHVDQKGNYEQDWIWNLGGGALLQKNRWYSVEQHVRLNTPGQKDGVIRAWLDGKLVFEKKGLRFRDTDKLKIEELWFNVWHGGTSTSPQDQTLFIDNLVIARSYIGPVGEARR